MLHFEWETDLDYPHDSKWAVIWPKEEDRGTPRPDGEFGQKIPEDGPFRICVSEKMFGGRPAKIGGCSVDATEDVQREWRIWVQSQQKQRWSRHAEPAGLTIPEFCKLRESTSADQLQAALKLLGTLKRDSFRSKYRRSLAEQIMKWIREPGNPHPAPLSWRQWRTVIR